MSRKSKYTEEDFKNKCDEIGVEYIGYHKEQHTGSVIEIICPNHKDKGVQNIAWGHYKDAKRKCPYCYGRYKTNVDIVSSIKDKNVELISEYKGCEKPIKCRCKQCGNEWETVPKVLTTNGSGCPQCGKLKASKKRKKTHEDFVNDLYKVNPNIEIIEEYKGVHTKIKCRCKIDGTIWYGYPANLLNLSAGCPTCNISGSERRLINILNDYGLNIIQQHTIDGCKLHHNLKFDAYDIDNDIAFEYNGEQHYYPIDFAGKGKEWAENELTKTKERDAAKRKFCIDNNITVITIPYWEKDNMETIIHNKLQEKGIYKS